MKRLSIVLLLLWSLASFAQVSMIYDDDGPVEDVGGVTNYGVFYKMVDYGWIKPLATVVSSSNSLSAPGVYAMAKYYEHTAIPIGANQQNTPACGNGCNSSTWNTGMVSNFDPIVGDTKANYENCVTTYRRILSAQPNASVVIVETGFATCLMQLLGTSGDVYSSLTGPQLVQAKVTMLVVMGGDYPTGAEWNFQSDAPDYANLFTTWTTQNGYPPVYLVGFTIGYIVCSGPPPSALTTKNPLRYALNVANRAEAPCVQGYQRPVWDQLAIMYGAWGSSNGGVTYFNVSVGGTNTVNATNGSNSWSSTTNSGHYYLTAAAAAPYFGAFLDGYYYRGMLARAPLVSYGVMQH